MSLDTTKEKKKAEEADKLTKTTPLPLPACPWDGFWRCGAGAGWRPILLSFALVRDLFLIVAVAEWPFLSFWAYTQNQSAAAFISDI